MSNSSFFILITCAALFAVYFILYGYFSYRKEGRNAKGVSKVFLVQGILLAGLYFGIAFLALLSPDSLGLKTSNKTKESSKATSSSTAGPTGSTSNVLEGSYEYPSDPIAAGMLSRGDEFLKQSNIPAAINEFKQGMNNEEYKDIFEKRMEYALSVKDDFGIYQRGLILFNKGDYESALNEFKDIKPSDLAFYSDVITKMESISSGSLISNTNNEGGASPAATGTEENSSQPMTP